MAELIIGLMIFIVVLSFIGDIYIKKEHGDTEWSKFLLKIFMLKLVVWTVFFTTLCFIIFLFISK